MTADLYCFTSSECFPRSWTASSSACLDAVLAASLASRA